jgi:hypothetical protein
MRYDVEQMERHGVDRGRYPFASFCMGRGWSGHKTAEAAVRAARRSARAVVRAAGGGGLPHHFAARTDTGEPV